MLSGKILLVANTDWYLYNFRLSLARFIRDQGFEVVMVSPAGPFFEEIQKEGFRCIEWKVGRRTMSPLGETRAVRHIYQIYQMEKPLLAHHFTIKPVLYGTLAARFARVPYVVNSVTGLGYVFLKEGWKGSALRALTLPFYRLALSRQGVWVIFENANDRETFIRLGLVRGEMSSVIRGVGVNENLFAPAPEPDTHPPLVVFPARMLKDKGLGTLVDAGRILRGRLAVRVALVGDPDPGNPATVTEAALRAWENEGLVEWWGFRRNMHTIYQNCHIVTLPSFGEGLPTVLIEAASCARPIVTTDVPGCREVVTHGVNGLLVPPGDAPALAQAIEMLANDASLRARMGAAGRQIVQERFTEHLVNRETFEVYLRAMVQNLQPGVPGTDTRLL
jgi:glycosyltransferase involved in cell wall biosynthesis